MEHDQLDREVKLNAPFAEWALDAGLDEADPHSVRAHATFTHETTGITRRSLLFPAEDGSWRFRFTGTEPGQWALETTGPGELGGRTGTVAVVDDGASRNGFLGTDDGSWVWDGTGEAMVPQLVMAPKPAAYWDGGVDTEAIESTIATFADGHGYTGFHVPGGGGWWFDLLGSGDTTERGDSSGPTDPDPRTFRVLEAFLLAADEAGAMTHLWLWRSDAFAASGPAGVGGPESESVRRLLRSIAARLGPIPGWSMGYGFDLHWWADADELQNWYDRCKEFLGGWAHPLGARADEYEMTNEELQESGGESLERRPLSAVYWRGDYVGHYDYRVAYPWYVDVTESEQGPHLQADRFRNRESDQFEHKDYTAEMTVRGLWHSTMAGGVGNVWGNLLPHGENDLGSQAFDNGATGEIGGARFEMDVSDRIRTYHEFWFGRDRFSPEYVPDNELTDGESGDGFLRTEEWTPITVCLRDPNHERYLFYAEHTESVTIDLRTAETPLSAVTVDARAPYCELDLDRLAPARHELDLADESDWAVAVGGGE